MKRLSFLAVLLLLAACAAQDLPPTPPPPGASVSTAGRAFAGMAGAMPDWAAPPVNVQVTPSSASYGDSVIVSVNNDFVYEFGYFYNSQVRSWEKFNLQGEKNQNWLLDRAVGNIPISETKFATGANYVVIYACSKSGSDWNCNNNKWMLVTIDVAAGAGAIPESANINQFVINSEITPFKVMSTGAKYDEFGTINVISYDARYSEPGGLNVLVHVFDFKSRQDVDQAMTDFFGDVIRNPKSWARESGHNVLLFLGDTDNMYAIWTSGKEIIWVETFNPSSANREIIQAYLGWYPSDLVK